MRKLKTLAIIFLVCPLASPLSNFESLRAAGVSSPKSPINGSETQLFLDDYPIASSQGLVRRVNPPERLAKPVLDHKRFQTNQPWLTVLRDADKGRFRIWYDRIDSIWYAESTDGIHWDDPRPLLNFPRHTYGAAIVDDAGREKDSRRRFKLAHWQQTRALAKNPAFDGGMWVAFSPDGLNWAPLTGNILLEFFPTLRYSPVAGGKIVRHSVGDIIGPFYDPIRKRYGVAIKSYSLPEDGYAPAPRGPQRRLVSMSTSSDFIHWERPWRIFWPDEKDEGLLEFYGMGAIHARGPLLIGLLRVLRDDLPCEEGGPKDGIGYTVLAWSRDGIHWERDRKPFLDRSNVPGSWDRAMAWITSLVEVGDELFFYYGGYSKGHKEEIRTGGRQIGLARGLGRDRYVSLSASESGGWLLTAPVVFKGNRLEINARTRTGGSLRVELRDSTGQSVPGYSLADSDVIQEDSITHIASWKGNADVLRFSGKPVQLRFEMRSADLFAFQFTNP